MTKDTFIQLLRSMIEGFESDGFQERMLQAKDAGDLPMMMGLPLAVQNHVFTQYGLDPQDALHQFKVAGEQYGELDEVKPLMERMGHALQGN